VINHFLGAALVVAPFFLKSAPITAPRISQEFFFVLVAFLMAVLFGIKKTDLRMKIAMGSVVVMAFISPKPFSFYHFYQMSMLLAGCLFLAVLFSNRDRIDFAVVSKYLATTCLLQCGYMILQHFDFDIYAELSGMKSEIRKDIRVFGSLGNPNHSGALVACLMPFLPWFLIPVAVVALILAKSAMPAICALVAMSVFILIKTGRARFIPWIFVSLTVLAAFLVGGVFEKTFLSDTHRIEVWAKALGEIGVAFIGKGIAWVPVEFSKHLIHGQKFYQLHNEWLELYSMGGLLFSVVAIYLIYPSVKNISVPQTSAALMALLVNSLGNFTFHIVPLFMVFAVCFAVQLSEKNL
jgi:hypothetical protein